jgi:hypothetical protein
MAAIEQAAVITASRRVSDRSRLKTTLPLRLLCQSFQ